VQPGDSGSATSGVAGVVMEALERMLAGSGLERSPAAAVARVLAEMLDDPGTNATARVGAAREFREVLERIAAGAPGGDRMTDFEERVLARSRV
jgi:hypothetical protein